MSNEGLPAQEQVIDPSIADIMVQCPIPGQENQPPQALGEFMQSDVGKRVGEAALATAGILEQTGMSKQEAVLQALGPAVARTESGEIMRAPAGERTPLETTVENDILKKK
jgi:hypothetical protein